MKRPLIHDLAILAGLLVPFMVLKAYALSPAVGDENIYFYNAWSMTQGQWPYRDFFFAHPPLHVLPGWLVYAVTGFQLYVAKMLPATAAAAAGVCVYLMTRDAAGRLPAAVAAALFLFSHDLLRASSHWTGINWSVAWLAGGMLAALRGRLVLSGVLFALGTTTGFYIFPATLMALTLIALPNPRAGLRFGLAFAVPFLLINVGFWLFGGSGFLDSVYLYHFRKPGKAGKALLDQSWALLFHNFFLLAAPLYLAPRVLRECLDRFMTPEQAKHSPKKKQRSRRERGPSMLQQVVALLDAKADRRLVTGLWAILFAAGYIFFLSRLTRVSHFYFLLLFPPCAVAGGLVAAWLRDAIKERQKLALAGLVAALVSGFIAYPYFEHKLGYFKRKEGKTSSYEFPFAPLPSWIHGLTKATVWGPDRTIGDRYTGIQYYLWHESRTFQAARHIAARLRADKAPEDAIFGDSTTTPLVALWAKMPIAATIVDTNSMRFRKGGITDPDDVVKRLKATYGQPKGELNWVLIHPRRGIATVPKIRAYFDAEFELVEKFTSRYHGTYHLLKRKGVERRVH